MKLDVDMMSAVTPGVLRELFTAPVDGTSDGQLLPPGGVFPQERAP